MTHTRLLFSHPVLRSNGIDYEESCKFNANVSVNINGKKIKLDIKYELTSNFLKELIHTKRAKYLALIKCSKTGRRLSKKSDSDTLFELDAREFRNKLLLSLYVVSEQDMEDFNSEEHDAEIRGKANNISAGAILALSNQYEILLDDITGDLRSIVHIKTNKDIPDWCYQIDLDNPFIKIEMNSKTYETTMQLRTMRPRIMFPLLYVPAIENAVWRLKSDEVDEDYHWVRAIKDVIEKHDINLETKNPNLFAQEFMKYPYGSIQSLLEGKNLD